MSFLLQPHTPRDNDIIASPMFTQNPCDFLSEGKKGILRKKFVAIQSLRGNANQKKKNSGSTDHTQVV